MTNKRAPYNDPDTMATISDWWRVTYPENKAGNYDAPMHIIELYQSYENYTGMNRYSQGWMDVNQFAKCLVAAQIADLGNGTWQILENWTPKEYEIRKAKVY